jgi:hypothetical protein
MHGWRRPVPQLLQPGRGYRVLSYIHLIDVRVTYLSQYYRGRERDVDDGKDKKNPRDNLVSTHFCGMRKDKDCCWSSGQGGRLVVQMKRKDSL